jgi:hypothetical protein
MYSLLFTDVNLKLITHCKSVMLSMIFFENAGLLCSSECMEIIFKTVDVAKSV